MWRSALLCVLLFLSGCESVNEALVRRMFMDGGLSYEMSDQILDGLERREKLPAQKVPSRPAPPFLDQG